MYGSRYGISVNKYFKFGINVRLYDGADWGVNIIFDVNGIFKIQKCNFQCLWFTYRMSLGQEYGTVMEYVVIFVDGEVNKSRV